MGEWKSYRNSNPTTGVIRYKIGEDHEYIDIEFAHVSNQIYRYKKNVIGEESLEEMITLAVRGDGLSTYINQHPEVRYGFTLIETAA